MDDYCAFSKNHRCLKREDYEITRHELEEADNLCHGNWIQLGFVLTQSVVVFLHSIETDTLKPIAHQSNGAVIEILCDQIVINPDVEHHNAYATFNIDGKDIDCFPVYIYTKDYAEAKTNRDDGSAVVLAPIDGTDTYYEKEQAANFDEVFGTNTYYVIDPEECMADNFKFAMLYGTKGKNGSGYPNPEIIQGIIDIVSK